MTIEEFGKRTAEYALDEYVYEGKTIREWIRIITQEPCEDCISRQAVIDAILKIHPVDTEYDCTLYDKVDVMYMLKELPTVQPEPKTDKYEYHTDHTDCIWYGSGGCPTTCSQYRDGWNDAMEYIYKDGKGYQPYRREW